MSNSSPRASRVAGLDAARGFAMVLVFASHFADAYLGPAGAHRAHEVVARGTFPASPMFMLVSGLLLGFLFAGHRDGFDRLRRKLVDRALFLLTVAHLVIVAAHAPAFGLASAGDFVYITDVVGLSVIVGSLAVSAGRPGLRLSFAAMLYAASTLLVFAWNAAPGSPAQLVKHLLVGHRPDLEESAFIYNFPVLPWMALYLAATVLGEGLARLRGAARGMPVATLAGLGALLAGAGTLMRGLRPLLALLVPGGTAENSPVRWLTGTGHKLPPGPAYLSFYAGIALLLLAGCLWFSEVRPGAAVLEALQALGRNSLFVFVLQYVVYYGVISALHLPWSPLWPLLLLGTALLHVAAARAWERAGGNRLLTVGYPSLLRAAERLTASASESSPVPDGGSARS